MRKVYGVGVNDYNGVVSVGNNKIKSYQIWKDMLKRCYDKKYQEKQPTYADCTVCEDWLKFGKFKEWFDANYPQHLEEQGIRLELDKDILVIGNKVYSPDACCFIPQRTNRFMANKQLNNTSGYTGVSLSKKYKKWQVQISDFNTSQYKHLGYFTNIEDAKDAYNKARKIEALKVKEYLRELGYDENIINKIK